jgi:hypothetical protein
VPTVGFDAIRDDELDLRIRPLSRTKSARSQAATIDRTSSKFADTLSRLYCELDRTALCRAERQQSSTPSTGLSTGLLSEAEFGEDLLAVYVDIVEESRHLAVLDVE